MNQAVVDMLARYECRGAGDYENALREIFQELALLGLWRSRFFEHGAFYGGTALRILHGLDRFSEDMDFSLLRPDPTFDMTPYCAAIEKELKSWGFPVQVELKKKQVVSAVESAFLKAGTLEQMLLIHAPESVLGRLHKNQVLRIKVEVDTDPPPDFTTTSQFVLQPIPFSVLTYSLPSLFAGKMHALLCRRWGNRVKGRDWFDLVWYVTQQIPLDLKHLSARLRQTGHWEKTEPISEEEFRCLLSERIDTLDVQAALKDVRPFLKRADSVEIWSSDFFKHIAERIVVA